MSPDGKQAEGRERRRERERVDIKDIYVIERYAREKENERGSPRDLNYLFIAGKGITRTRARGVAAEVNRNEISTGAGAPIGIAPLQPPRFPATLPVRSRFSNTDPKCFSISRKIPRRAPPSCFFPRKSGRCGGAEG